ncbi:IclR family transcriptional regulator [Streptomyces sp. NPDC056227]|uniref:IclR family transcriptional regulator n=1 Tax=Streptomyces sp. NPDC056227 TaxID=3345753 RepID=UPI0035DB4578
MNTDRFSRIFDVLDALAGQPEGMSLTEISQAVGAPVSSTHNLLQTMLAAEVLVATDDLRYFVGPRAVRIGLRIINSLDVRTVGRQPLEALARKLDNDVYLAVRVGMRVIYVDRFQGTQPVSVNIRLGDSLALHATAVGKLFAAFQPDLRGRVLRRTRPQLTSSTITDPEALRTELGQIAELGVSVSREEAYEGIVGFAVPVRDSAGTLVAAIHISTLQAVLTAEREAELIEQSLRTAEKIEAELGVPEIGTLPSTSGRGQRRTASSPTR